MYPVVTACLHAPKFFHFIKLVVSVGIRESVDPALHLFLVIVHRNIKTVKCPEQSVGGTDLSGNLFDITLLERLSFSRCGKTIKTAELVTGNNTVFVVEAKVYPRTQSFFGDGEEQFHFEAVLYRYAVNRGGFGIKLSE